MTKKERCIQFLLFCFWGVLTTLVNLAVYFFCRRMHISLTPATVIAWFFAVLFAFFTNKKYVFNSCTKKRDSLVECGKFYGARLFSGVLEVVFMLLFAKVLNIDSVMNSYIPLPFLSGLSFFNFTEFWSKFFTEIIVVFVNYILSILFVFRRKKNNE
ncbi:MAG: GtrA family protein [Treponema sp.]|nr:GtrA family protein [Treponema sp.]